MQICNQQKQKQHINNKYSRNFNIVQIKIIALQPGLKMKSISVKNAQKWLQRLKIVDHGSYREFVKILKKFDQNYSHYDCFVKMNTTLASQTNLIQELNLYMDEGNQMYLNAGLNSRVQEFLKKVKKSKPDSFDVIVEMIGRWDRQRRDREINVNDANTFQSQNTGIKNQINQYFKNEPEFLVQVQHAFANPQDIITKKLQLAHLKNKNQTEQNEELSKSLPVKKVKKDYVPRKQKQKQKQKQKEKQIVAEKKQIPQFKPKKLAPFLNITQQTGFFEQLILSIESQYYQNFLKMIFLYKEAVITCSEMLSQVYPLFKSSHEFQGFKEIMKSREDSRKRLSRFRPLCDSNFDHQLRITPSYVVMPNHYPNVCPPRTKYFDEILNNKYVSVPRGSEETFNIRPKNIFQISLTRVQDEHYETDLYLMKLKKSIQALEMLKNKLQNNAGYNIQKSKQLKLIISLKTVQQTYKNASKQYQHQLEDNLKKNPYQTIQIFIFRLSTIYEQLKYIKNIHGNKAWAEITHKNYYKSLQFKVNEFRRIQKFKIKPQTFIEQLKLATKNLYNRGRGLLSYSPFQEKKLAFSVLSSFEEVTRKQKCEQRNIPIPIQYNMDDYANPTLLPAQILSFQDSQALSLVYSLAMFYMEQGGVCNQQEKTRNRQFFQIILYRFFNFDNFQRRGLSQLFNEQQFYNNLPFLNSTMPPQINYESWLFIEQQIINQSIQQSKEKPSKSKFIYDAPTKYSYLPPEDEGFNVFYGSQNFYALIRFAYIFYQRIIKMKELAGNQQNQICFQLLFYAFIKMRQNSKYEEYLYMILGKSAYMYATFFKLSENLIKSLSAASICAITSHSLNKHYGVNKEQLYYMLMNRYITSLASSNPKMVRFNFDIKTGLLYIHHTQVPSLTDDQTYKQNSRRRSQFTTNIDLYATQPPNKLEEEWIHKFDYYGKRKYSENNVNGQINCLPAVQTCDVKYINERQYCFACNCYKFVNLPKNEDVMINGQRTEQSMNSYWHEAMKNAKLSRMLFG